MKQTIVLVGPARSGKSRLARLIADGKKSVTVHTRYRFKSFFDFSFCEKDTEVLVIDDVPIKHLRKIIFHTGGPLIVRQKNKEPFFLKPQIIITTCCERSKLPTLVYTQSFNVIELTDNYNLNKF